MTTTVSPLASISPRRRLILAGFVVSLVLNVFFVVGAIWTVMHPPAEPPNPTGRFRELEAGLNLDHQQRPSFQHYTATMRERTSRMHQEVGPLIATTWDEMAKTKPDEAQIMQLVDQAADKRRDFQRDVATATLSFLSTLTPAQREKFIAITRERRPSWSRQPASR